MDPEKLLNEINKGKGISEEVLLEVVELLSKDCQKTLSADDIYSYISILGVAEAKSHRHLLEKFIDYKDPLTVVKVLKILCSDWGFGAEYLERVISFALGVSWDEEDDLRQAAMGILGEFLHGVDSDDDVHKDQRRQVTDLLFSVFEDKQLDVLSRISAYRALCRAAKLSWEDITAECMMIDVESGSKDIDWEVLKKLRKI